MSVNQSVQENGDQSSNNISLMNQNYDYFSNRIPCYRFSVEFFYSNSKLYCRHHLRGYEYFFSHTSIRQLYFTNFVALVLYNF